MARANDIIFCLKATNIVGQGATATRVLSAITPEYIPGLFTFSLVITILDYDMDKEHSIQLCFSSPDNECLINMNAVLPVVAAQSNLPHEYMGVTVAVDFNNVDFKSSGLYRLNIILDNEEIGSKEIFVKGKNE